MSAPRALTLLRRQQILDRQDPAGWRSAYIPSTLATREEAPSISRARQIWAEQLGRYCHVISGPEARAATVALYHPALFELHEQRMLSTEPRPHPLALHPDHPGLRLTPLRGTLDVAQRLDMLKVHPVVHFMEGDQPRIAPFPLIGDLLLSLRDKQGPYCVNWTVKNALAAFDAPIRTNFLPADPARAISDEQARHAIEEAYYRDAGIRTQRVVEADIDDELFATMNHLLLWADRPVEVSSDVRSEIVDRFRACLRAGRPALDEMVAMRSRHPFAISDFKAILFRAIWRRELRVDLWSFISVDRPLRPEVRDVLTHFAAWFARGEQDE